MRNIVFHICRHIPLLINSKMRSALSQSSSKCIFSSQCVHLAIKTHCICTGRPQETSDHPAMPRAPMDWKQSIWQYRTSLSCPGRAEEVCSTQPPQEGYPHRRCCALLQPPALLPLAKRQSPVEQMMHVIEGLHTKHTKVPGQQLRGEVLATFKVARLFRACFVFLSCTPQSVMPQSY